MVNSLRNSKPLSWELFSLKMTLKMSNRQTNLHTKTNFRNVKGNLTCCLFVTQCLSVFNSCQTSSDTCCSDPNQPSYQQSTFLLNTNPSSFIFRFGGTFLRIYVKINRNSCAAHLFRTISQHMIPRGIPLPSSCHSLPFLTEF